MLSLTRSIRESIVIGAGPGRVVVTLLDIRNGKARIGIEATPDIPVDRSEVRERKDADRAEADRLARFDSFEEGGAA